MFEKSGIRKVIFLHIAKTAGTSLVEYFKQCLPPEQFSSHGDFLVGGRSERISASDWQRLTFISGHFGFNYISEVVDDAYSFTFLRSPLQRVLSFYKFCMYPDMQEQFPVARAAKELGLNGFLMSGLPEVREMLDNQQTWQLARNYWQEDRAALSSMSDEELLQLAKSHLRRFSYVGTTEDFDQDFCQILRELDLPQPQQVPHELSTPKPVNLKRISDEAFDLLASRQCLDQQLYDWVLAEKQSGVAWTPDF